MDIKISGCIDRRKLVVNQGCYHGPYMYIGQFVNPGGGCKVLFFSHYFIRVHENLVQHPSNNISINNVLVEFYNNG